MGDSSDESAASPARQPKRATGGVGRACDFCHRMKMKCIGKENPPCNRCKDSGHDCTFDVPRKAKAVKLENRVKDVEGQIDSMQSSLQELLRLQRAQMAAQGTSTEMYRTSASSVSHHLPSNIYSSPGTSLSMRSLMGDPNVSSRVFHSDLPSSLHTTSSGYQIPIDTPDTAANLFGMRSTSSHQHNHLRTTTWPTDASAKIRSPGSDDEDIDINDPLVAARVLAPFDNMIQLAEAARLQADQRAHEEEIANPIPSPYDSSRGRKRQRENGSTPVKDGEDADMISEFSSSKGLNLESDGKKVSLVDRATSRNGTTQDGKMSFRKGSYTQNFLGPIEMGYCTEEKGKELFDLFFNRCSIYVPVFEPGFDTWESLRKRSPFTITAIIMVGAKVQDGSKTPSELQTRCREHAEKIAMSTLFTPVAGVEDLQAMIILAAWGDTSWRPAGHALRMAMEIGLFRCLSSLYLRGSPAGKTDAQLLEEKPLVVGARVWLALYKQEHEMAYNLGRPASSMNLTHARLLLDHPHSIETDSRLVATCELLHARFEMHQAFCNWPSGDFPGLDEKIKEVNEKGEEWRKDWESFYDRKGLPATHFLRESLTTQRCHFILSTNARILTGIRNKRDVGLLSEERRDALLKAIRAAATIVEMALRSQSYTRNFRYANHYTHVGVAFAAMFLIRLASLLPEAVNLRQTGRDVEKVAQMLSEVPGFQYAHLLRDVIGKARRKQHLPPASKPASPRKDLQALPSLTSPGVNSNENNSSFSWNSLLPTNWATNTSNNSLAPTNLDFTLPDSTTSQDTDFSHLDFMLVDQMFNSGTGNGGLGTALLGGLGGDAGRRGVGYGGSGYSLDQGGNRGFSSMVGGNGSDGLPAINLQDFNFSAPTPGVDGLLSDTAFNDLDNWFPFPPLDQDQNSFPDAGF